MKRLFLGVALAMWAVVLDLDETAFNNQAYQFERAAYAAPFDSASWEYGVNWFVLPNPSYGGWERVVTRKQD